MREMHPASLENLKKDKPRKAGHGYRYALPQEKIDELFAALAEGMKIKPAAKKVGICFETAKKYFKRGDASRGIKPLQMRLEVFQEKISEKMNVLLEEQVSERLNLVRNMIKNFEQNIAEGISPEKMTIRDLERLIKLEAFLCGGIKTTEKETKMLTADQIQAGEDG